MMWVVTLSMLLQVDPGGSGSVGRFAVIIGNNHSTEGLAELRYADDDAVLYAQQLAPFLQSTELLSVLDDASQRRFPGVASTTHPPSRAEVGAALTRAFDAVRAWPGPTELSFIFVGHGGLDEDGHGFLHLADGRFSRADLFNDVIASSPADYTHVIVDACHAYTLVAGRGDQEPQTRKQAFAAFLSSQELARYPKVGVLIASTDSNETHEWSRLSAGVFSHLVRAALAGAADINGDGRIEYSEVAGFSDAASVELGRYGKALRVFAWPPSRDRSAALVDLRLGRDIRYVVMGETLAGHIVVESEEGLRWTELNKEAGVSVTLALPASRGFFMRDDLHERWIAAGEDTVWVDDPPRLPSATASRGADEVALERGLFAASFGPAYYRGFVSGKDHLVPVSAGQLLVSRPEPLKLTFGVEAGYAASLFALLPEVIEHGAFARLLINPDDTLFFSVGFDAGYASLNRFRGERATRLGAFVGAGTWLRTGRHLALRGVLEAGIAPVGIGGAAASYDVIVPALQGRVGAELLSFEALRIGLDAGLGAYRVTIDREEQTRVRPHVALRGLWLL